MSTRHAFICTSCTLNGAPRGVCSKKGSPELLQYLTEALEEADLSDEVEVTFTGCLGRCVNCPVMVVYPEGTWYGNLDEDAIDRIVEEHFEGGTPVADLQI